MISAFIITRNEEGRIGQCIDALDFADEVVVVDAESTDRTVEIARARGARVMVEPWRGYSSQRNFAISQCRGEWILYMDADERPGPGFADEVRAVAEGKHPRPADAYYVNSREFFIGDYLRHGGFGLRQANRKIRLWRAGAGSFAGEVHEVLVTSRTTAFFASHVLHRSTAETVSGHLRKLDRYSALAAEEARRSGSKPSVARLLGRPARVFLSRFIRRHGWRDGVRGLIAAILQALYPLLVEAKLFERSHERARASK